MTSKKPNEYVIVLSDLDAYWLTQILVSNSGEGNGTPLQYSCLENPMDGGAWKLISSEDETANCKTKTKLCLGPTLGRFNHNPWE